MKKHQPDIKITLNYLNNNSNVRYILPCGPFGKISHPRYKNFETHPSVIPFICKSINQNDPHKDSYLNLDDQYEENYFNLNILSLRAWIDNARSLIFCIEDFSRYGLCSCHNTWCKIRSKLEKEFAEDENVIFLWPPTCDHDHDQ